MTSTDRMDDDEASGRDRARVRDVFQAVCDLTPNAAEAKVRAMLAGNAELQRAVLRLLAAHRERSDPLPSDGAAFRDVAAGILGGTPDLHATDGRIIGQFRIRRLIGVGGMGVVHEAEQERPPRVIALKLLPPGLASPSSLRRFEFEAEALARMRHPGIAHLYEVGVHHDAGASIPYIAMELVDGAVNIVEYARKHQLTIVQRVHLIIEVCEAIADAHAHGVIHRDLKPSNLLVDGSGRIKVIDFGVAQAVDARGGLTLTGQRVGTPAYMSPEQCVHRAGALDARTDVYSLAVVLYELLTDRLPYGDDELATEQLFDAIRHWPPIRLGRRDRRLGGDLECIIAKALEKSPLHRYQTMHELAADLRRSLAHEPVLARRLTPWRSAVALARRHRAATIAASIVAVSVVGMAVAAMLTAISVRSAAAREARERARSAGLAALDAVASGHSRMLERAVEEAFAGARDPLPWELRHLRHRREQAIAVFEGPPNLKPGRAFFACGDRAIVGCFGGSKGVIWRLPPGDASWGTADGVTRLDLDALDSVVGAADRGGDRMLMVDRQSRAQSFVDTAGGVRREGESWRCVEPGYSAIHDPQIAMTDDGRVVAITGRREQGPDEGIFLWRLDQQRQVVHPPSMISLAGSPVSMDISSDGRRVVVATGEGLVRLYDTSDLGAVREVARLRGHLSNLQSCAFNCDGTLLATSAMDRMVKIWSVARLEQEAMHLPSEEPGAGTSAPGEAIAAFPDVGGGVRTIAFSPSDPSLLACGSVDGLVRLWQLEFNRGGASARAAHGAALRGIREAGCCVGHTDEVLSIDFSSNGRRIVSSSRDGRVRVWSNPPFAMVPECRGFRTSVGAVGFLVDSRTIVSVAEDGQVLCWDRLNLLGPRSITGVQRRSHSMAAVHPTKPLAVVANVDGECYMLDIAERGSQPRVLHRFRRPGTVATAVAVSPDGGRVACAFSRLPSTGDDRSEGARVETRSNGEEYEVVVLDVDEAMAPDGVRESTDSATVIAVSAPVTSMDFRPGSRGSELAVALGSSPREGSIGGRLLLMHLGTGGATFDECDESSGGILVVRHAPDGRVLYTGSTDSTIAIRDPRSGSIQELLRGHDCGVTALAVHPIEERLASGSDDGTILIWSTSERNLVARLRGGPGPSRSLAFSPDGKTLASASSGPQGSGNVVRLWETDGSMGLMLSRSDLEPLSRSLEELAVAVVEERDTPAAGVLESRVHQLLDMDAGGSSSSQRTSTANGIPPAQAMQRLAITLAPALYESAVAAGLEPLAGPESRARALHAARLAVDLMPGELRFRSALALNMLRSGDPRAAIDIALGAARLRDPHASEPLEGPSDLFELAIVAMAAARQGDSVAARHWAEALRSRLLHTPPSRRVDEEVQWSARLLEELESTERASPAG